MKMRPLVYVLSQVLFVAGIQAGSNPFEYGTGELKPGEIVIKEFFEELVRIDPFTGDRFTVPLGDTDTNFFTNDIEIDRDGQIILLDDDDRLIQFNPANSVSTPISPPFDVRLEAFTLAADGTILGLTRNQLIRFDPVTQTSQTMDTSALNGGFFSPSSLAAAPTGEVYVGEFFEGLWHIDLETESAIPIDTNAINPSGDILAAGENGELYLTARGGQLIRLDPESGAVEPLTQVPTFTADIALDVQGRILVAHSDGVDRYDPITGATEQLVSGESFFSARSIAVFGSTLALDFNGDGFCDVQDMDELLANLGGPNTTYNWDSSDDNITLRDRDAWLSISGKENIGRAYLVGDTDLDGDVDSADLNNLGLAWQSTDNPSWRDGDFNGDGMVNSTDLNAVGLNWQRGVEPAAANPVPEPSATIQLFSLIALTFLRRRKR